MCGIACKSRRLNEQDFDAQKFSAALRGAHVHRLGIKIGGFLNKLFGKQDKDMGEHGVAGMPAIN